MTKEELAQKIKGHHDNVDAHNRFLQATTIRKSSLALYEEAELEAIATEVEEISKTLHDLWVRSANILIGRVDIKSKDGESVFDG